MNTGERIMKINDIVAMLQASEAVLIEVDVTGDCPLMEFLAEVQAQAGAIVNFEASGPAGGHPCLTLAFPDAESARTFLDDAGYDGDLDDYCLA
jgi:hypothetical protein